MEHGCNAAALGSLPQTLPRTRVPQHGDAETRPSDLRAFSVDKYAACDEGLRGSLQSISVPVTAGPTLAFEGQIMQKLEHLLGATQEITHAVKCLQEQQVRVLQGSMRQPCVDQETAESKQPRLKTAAATCSHNPMGVSPKPAVGIATDASGQDFNALQKQVTVLEMTLQRHMVTQCATLESRLEQRLQQVFQHIKKVLLRCDACNASCERVESILNFSTSKAKRQRLLTSTLMTDVLAKDVLAEDSANQHAGFTKSEELQITHDLATPQKFVSEEIGFGVRGWAAHPDDDIEYVSFPWLTRTQVHNGVSFALVVVDLTMASVMAHIEIEHALAHTSSPEWLLHFQLVLAFAFAAELIARWRSLGLQFLMGTGHNWNIMDLLITSISLVDAVLSLANVGSLAHVTFFRLLRLMRLVRVATVFRKLRGLYEFGLIMECMARAVLPICWSFLLLGFIVYVSAILILQLLEPHVHSTTDVDSNIIRLYGGFGQCFYTLLLAVSGGVPWNEFVQPLSRLSESFCFIFAIYVCLVNFVVLNILSAVYVSYVGRCVQNHHEQFIAAGQVQAVAAAETFRVMLKADKGTNDGRISSRRLEKILSENENDILKKLDLNIETALGIFKLRQQKETYGVNIDDFICSMMQVKGNPTSIHVVTLMYESQRIISHVDDLSARVQTMFDHLCDEDSLSPSARV